MLPTITRATVEPTARVLVLNGQGVSVRVADGQLRIEDGTHRSARRVIAFDRATTQLDRLLILMRSGWLSFDAIEWCHALGIQVVMIDRDLNASVLQSGSSRVHDARLRRSQAVAPSNERGVAVIRYLLGAKCSGQAGNLLRLGYDSAEIRHAAASAENAGSIRQCLDAEGRLAGIYWQCFAPIELQWEQRKNGRKSHTPEHWRTVGQRNSPKTDSPHRAIAPFHAMLNFLYKLAEVETTIALHAVGLDPALGIVHTDSLNRDSMSLDVLEAVRPSVDGFVLDMLETRVFSHDDFGETETGVVCMSNQLRQELAETLPLWRTAVAPVAEHVANLLRPENRLGRKTVRTPLTNANIKLSQAQMRERRIAAMARTVLQAGGQTPESWDEIYPLVKIVDTEQLVAATGLSHRFVRRIKSGEKRPGRWHWSTLYSIAKDLQKMNLDREARDNAKYDREFEGEQNPWIPDDEDIGAEHS